MAKKTPPSEQRQYIEYVPLDDLVSKYHPDNPKGHDLDTIGKSINRFGFVAPPTMDERTGNLVAGHGRIEQLSRMHAEGQSPPARITVDEQGRWLVPVVRGISFNSDAEVKAYLVADNRLTALGGWDDGALLRILQDTQGFDAALLEATGYTPQQVDDLSFVVAAMNQPPPSLDDLEEEFGEYDDDGGEFAPTIKVTVTQEVKAQYDLLMQRIPGGDEGIKFGKLLQAVEPFRLDELLE